MDPRQDVTPFRGQFPPRPMTEVDQEELHDSPIGDKALLEILTDDGYLWHFSRIRASDTRTFEGIENDDESAGTSTATYHTVSGILVRVQQRAPFTFVADTWEGGQWSSISIHQGEIENSIGDRSKEVVAALCDALVERMTGTT